MNVMKFFEILSKISFFDRETNLVNFFMIILFANKQDMYNKGQ